MRPKTAATCTSTKPTTEGSPRRRVPSLLLVARLRAHAGALRRDAHSVPLTRDVSRAPALAKTRTGSSALGRITARLALGKAEDERREREA